MNYLRQYIIVGGMPQAVDTFIKTNNFDKVDKAKRRILNLYRDDIRKHADNYALDVEAIFEEIPSQLKISTSISSFHLLSKAPVSMNTKTPSSGSLMP